MKSTQTVRLLACLLALLLLCSLSVACSSENGGETESPAVTTGSTPAGEDSPALPAIWENATYTEAKAFGEGEKTFSLEVIADGHSVTFTVSTNEEYLGAPLLTHGLVSGDEGPYGLYIKAVNGMVADYNVDQTYWSVSKGGTMLMTGVDSTPVENGAHYELTRTKG